jgi:hypothetical protein
MQQTEYLDALRVRGHADRTRSKAGKRVRGHADRTRSKAGSKAGKLSTSAPCGCEAMPITTCGVRSVSICTFVPVPCGWDAMPITTCGAARVRSVSIREALARSY